MADCVIPEGYKETVLGVIPKEWEVKRLGDICSYFKSGESITSKDISEKGKYPVYGGNGLRGYTDKKYTHDGTYILIGRQGALCGNINYVIGKCYISEHAIAVQTKNNSLWLRYKLDFWNLNRYSESSAQPGLSVEKLIRYKLTVPPLEEQQKISEVLSVWDKAIEKQTQLIEKLELRKKGLMQQLLTGKKRLPGFSEEWKKVAIKDYAMEISLKNRQNENWEVLSCTKYDGLVPSLQYFGRQVFSKDIAHYKVVPQYCFAYATNHIEEGSIGYQSIYKNALISPMYTVFKTDNNVIDDIFLYKLLKSHRAIHLYNVMMEGSIDRRGGLRWDNFSTIKFLLPDIKEQSAIADILVSCDNEIILAKQKLNSFQHQKKGLMQVLLTGKKRVII